jgi:hypothetical protein
MRRVSDLYVPSQRIFAFLTLSVPADHLSHRFCAKVLLSSPRRDLFAMVCRWLDSQPAIDDHPPRSGGGPLTVSNVTVTDWLVAQRKVPQYRPGPPAFSSQ